MRYYFDTEFNENVEPIDIISIGIVAEDGREFYAVNQGYEMGHRFAENPKTRDDYPSLWSCNDWVKKNVFPHLYLGEENMVTRIGGLSFLKESVVEFVGPDPRPEFWAYYGTYDWYLLTRWFKGFENMPSKWPHVCYDLHQYARHLGAHRNLPPKLEPAHNALIDARWTKLAFEKVKEFRNLNVPYTPGSIWP